MLTNAAARSAARRISDAGAAMKSNFLCKQMLIRSFTEVTATASPSLKGRVHEGVRSQSAKR
jgi:hypothetical protein